MATKTPSTLLLFVLLGTTNVVSAAPNFVIFIADDMSWGDCGAYGHPTIKTPNIDRLAAEGMRFENAFLTISSCSPSRASIITGRYPHRTDAEELHWPLPGDQVTFTELLRKRGYWCGAAGKWHLGDEVKDRFDKIMAADTSGFQLPTGKAAETGKFTETTEGDVRSGCTDWVPLLKSRPRDQPFCLWLAALDPHRPYDSALPSEYAASDVRLPPYHPDHESVRQDYLDYYAEISRLDRFVGEVLQELADQGVEDNTFVLFLSDNGRPFPRDKTTLYDSGIRTPFIVRFPGRVQAGAVTSSLVSSIDIAPTLLELADAGASATMDGQSFVPILNRATTTTRKFVYAEKNWHDFEDHVRAVRDVRFKYIRNYYNDLPNTPPADAVRSPTYAYMKQLYEEGQLATISRQACFASPRPTEELYDTLNDPHETKNLAEDPQYGADLVRLRSALKQWETETRDSVPKLRTADEFDRVTGKPTAARRRPRWSKAKMVAAGLVAP